MTFGALEASRDSGKPIFLATFTYGGTKVWRHTNAEFEVTSGGYTYTPFPITYDRIAHTSGADRASLKVTIGWDSPLAQFLLGDVMPWELEVEIRKAHAGDTDSVLVFSGVASAVTYSPGVVTLSCETPNRNTPVRPSRRHFTKYCPHQLYGPDCQANPNNFKVDTTTVSVSGAVVRLPSGWNGSFQKTEFLHGVFTWVYAFRPAYAFIIGVDAATDDVTLSWIPSGLTSNYNVSLSIGCDKTAATCSGVFNNLPNFGGLLVELSDSFTPFGREP